jgi:hypothetical protein
MTGNVLIVVSDADRAGTLVLRALAEAPHRVGQLTLLSWSGLDAERELRLSADCVPFDRQVELVHCAGFVRGAVRRQLSCSTYGAVIATSKVAAVLERGRCGRMLRRAGIPLIAVG